MNANINIAPSYRSVCIRLGVLASAVSLASCASNFEQGYDGDQRPPEQVATVSKPAKDLLCSDTVIAGTDERGPIRTREVAVLPGERKVYLKRNKWRSAAGSSLLLHIVEIPIAGACYRAPFDQCIEFSFQAQKLANYIVVAADYDDYKLKDQSSGQIVSVGRILPEQLVERNTFTEFLFQRADERIYCPPKP